MENFIYRNPVTIAFGQGSIAKLSKLIPPTAQTILITYGGGSIQANGTYDQVIQALQTIQAQRPLNYLEFGGIEPNPRYETCLKAVEICQKEQVDFLLAIGGGSVLDGTKFIAAASCFHEENPWEILTSMGRVVQKALPLGCVLTLPATGSEMNPTAVISRESTQEKTHFASPHVYPQFSILDPECTYSLPPRQSANGVVDAFVHTLEQYATYPSDAPLQDRQAEAILMTLIEEGPKVLKDPQNYNARANIMWSATQALNGNIGQGVPQDWSTHGIGHEITALYGLDHAQTLAVIWPGVMSNQFSCKKDKLAQYGRRIWHLDGDDESVARQAIDLTEKFFEDMGCQTHLQDYHVNAQEAAQRVRHRFEERGLIHQGLGEKGKITAAEIEKIILSRA